MPRLRTQTTPCARNHSALSPNRSTVDITQRVERRLALYYASTNPIKRWISANFNTRCSNLKQVQ
ncbi:hypothetical protein T440DRAFT_466153 [Plenodomus tracheiphilus IPT5]|uniref:Uncharacterized protein n=1 Tax=Plenodomus tracheiphilus IPT5 TaxID=1408161 RepID=A0A6A7BCC2_9PLEO|nr:hypothetical protein T440DRAFT_466153 [Plenodomus tracheiphilus IPT5]